MSYEDGSAPCREHGLAPISGVLARYPDITGAELGTLKSWFMREASALDVGMLASDESIAAQYQQFRADHLDRLGAQDAGKALLWLLGVAALIALVVFIAVR